MLIKGLEKQYVLTNDNVQIFYKAVNCNFGSLKIFDFIMSILNLKSHTKDGLRFADHVNVLHQKCIKINLFPKKMKIVL